MEYMDAYRQMYPASSMQGYRVQAQQGHQFPAMWSQAQLLALYQQNPQRAAAVMMGHSPIHASKQTEPKPRLAKDEVEVLEREFAKNQKPNSSVKRDLAEKMGVEVPRINNWFQNRRAKEKQMKKAREFEAQQAKDRDSVESKSDSEGGNQSSDTEGLDLDDTHASLTVSTAFFQSRATVQFDNDNDDGGGDDNDNTNDDDDDDDDENENGDTEDVDNHLDTGHSSHHRTLEPISTTIEVQSPRGSDSDGFVHDDMISDIPHAQFNTDLSDLSPFHGIEQLVTNHMHSGFQSPMVHSFEHTAQSQHHGLVPTPDMEAPPTVHADVPGGPLMFDSMESMSSSEYFGISNPPSFPSQLLADTSSSGYQAGEHDMMSMPSSAEIVKIEDLSPASMSASPPTTADMRFKSPPPPTDIAGRRNMRRPAPLGPSALRSASLCHGIRTGIDPPRRLDAPSPMRRIASATGMSGRIQKPLLTGPRSPFALERNREALLHTIHQPTCSPIMDTVNSAISSWTLDAMNMQGLRETTVSTTTSDEEQGYTFGPLGAPFFKAEQAIKTPPGTPLRFHEPMFPQALDQAWGFAQQQDEPLPTPSLCSHGSELDFSVAPSLPAYVASQPVTPSFPSAAIGPTYGGFLGHHGLPGTEYTFPDAYAVEVPTLSSPSLPKLKQFQFAQNVTPQDFAVEK